MRLYNLRIVPQRSCYFCCAAQMVSHGCDLRRATHADATPFAIERIVRWRNVRVRNRFSDLDFIQSSFCRAAHLAKSYRDATRIGSSCEVAANDRPHDVIRPGVMDFA
jgi:hypothetical protein